jgi:signal transduction histidine kinase
MAMGGLAAPGVSAAAAPDQKQVLVLYSTRRDAQIVTLGEQELPKIFEEIPGGLDYYSEYLDRGRFYDAKYQAAFREFLNKKYSGIRFDAIVAMQDTAAAFVTEDRTGVFAGVPIVFFGNSSAVHLPDSTGIATSMEFGETLALASVLHPDLRHVFVVGGSTGDDKLYERVARQQFRAFEPRLEITYLSGLPTAQLEAKLANLPPQSIVYYLIVDQDGAGQKVHPLEYLDRVTAVANAPTYCWVDSAIGHGVVGGSLKDQRKQVDAVGALALRVLKGERADSIPVTTPNLNVSQVDWRELQRWGIDEALVPAGTVVNFRELSVWSRYRSYVIAAAVLLLGQTALIAGLLLQRRRRRSAEEQVRGSQVALRTSYERIRDLGGRLLHAQESERARIARELHDDISQQMALLTIDLELLGGAVQPAATGMAGEALTRAHGIARSVHDLSHRLHPAKLRLIGLVPALQGLQREMSPSGLAVSFRHKDVPPQLSLDLTLCLFRIAQEALNNAAKHGKAASATVTLCADGEQMLLTVVDDGVGFDVDAAWSRGLGLISMSERLDAIGGTLTVHSRPGHGTRIEVAAPIYVSQETQTAAV